MTSKLDELVLRLATGTPGPLGGGRKPVQVRQYQRLERGRVQAVRQHVQSHVAGTGPHKELAGNLKAGNVVQLGLVQYAVTSVKPYSRKSSTTSSSGPNTKGTSSGVNTSKASSGGLNTGGAASTASAGQTTSAAADPQAILDAAAKAAKVAFNAPEVAIELRQVSNGKSYGVLAARTVPVLVVR